jgi:alpha-beta hydrolase superfamily lysophospholipase
MESLTTRDGVRLHLRRWPAAGAALGTVQIVHGLGEHIGRYEALAATLNAAGWNVAGHDQRGHGQSEGARGALPGEYALLLDLADVIDHLRGPGRHVLLGHSLGGLVTARFVAGTLVYEPGRWTRDVDGLVLSSPALDIGLGWPRRLLLRLLCAVAPRLGLGNGLKPSWLSHDEAVVRRYREDPLVHGRVTPGLVRFMLEAARVVQRRATRWRTPTLLLWAGADRCVEPAGSEAFAAAAPPAVTTAQAFPEMFHEIFNEPERAQVTAALVAWLQRLAAPVR